MLHFPYHVDLPLEMSKPLGELSGDEMMTAITEREWRSRDVRLALMAEDVAILPETIGLCAVAGSAHDYAFQTVLMQRTDGQFFRLSESKLSDTPVTFLPATLDLDLPTEFSHLQTDGTQFRGPVNPNIDQSRGYPGRISTIYIVAKGDAEWLYSPRLLIGGIYANTATNRLFRAVLDMEHEVTFI